MSKPSSGTPRGVATNIQEIYQLVLLTNASGFIVAHNHPGFEKAEDIWLK